MFDFGMKVRARKMGHSLSWKLFFKDLLAICTILLRDNQNSSEDQSIKNTSFYFVITIVREFFAYILETATLYIKRLEKLFCQVKFNMKGWKDAALFHLNTIQFWCLHAHKRYFQQWTSVSNGKKSKGISEILNWFQQRFFKTWTLW